MVSEFEARRQIVEAGQRLWQRGFVAANDGNISVRLGPGRVLVTPTGVSKGFMSHADLIVVDQEGRVIDGSGKPTSELPMHLFVYARRPDVSAIVHAHPPKATGFAVAGVPLAQCILPEVILTLGKVPITPYATPSTDEVPASIDSLIGEYNALLLKNHGALALGADVTQAYHRMETIEHFAEITLVARQLGGTSPLTREEVGKLLRVREGLGLPGVPGATDGPAAVCELSEPDGVQKADEDALVEAVLKEVLKNLGTG